MRSYKAFIVYFLVNYTLATAQESNITPRVMSLSLDDEAITHVHLAPGYATAIRMPEEITSIVIGDPAKFKAEHSESESRLAFLKPLTTKPAESNALITMKSGQQVNLHLVSPGTVTSEDPRVDFYVEYRKPATLLIASGTDSFFVPQTQPISEPNAESPAAVPKKDWVEDALGKQKKLTLQPEGHELQAAVGETRQQGSHTAVAFSVMNRSKEIVELLPPQIEISGRVRNGSKQTRDEPIAISEYRMTSRRLRPGERADGVAVFERPAFKESSEKLELRLGRADQVDHPLVLDLPFIAAVQGGSQ